MASMKILAPIPPEALVKFDNLFQGFGCHSSIVTVWRKDVESNEGLIGIYSK
jgi:hypothetical protein